MKSFLASVILLVTITFQLFGNHADSLAVHRLLTNASRWYKLDRARAIGYYQQAVSLADSKDFIDDSLASAMFILSANEYYRGNTEKAIAMALKTLNYYKGTQNPEKTIKLLTLVGDILRGNNLYNQSYQYLNEAKTIALKLNNRTILSSVYNRLAAIYFEDVQIPYDTTEKYARLSLAIAEKDGDEALSYNNYNILGVLETKRGNLKKSLEYLRRAYSLVERSSPEDVPLVLTNIARDYYLLSDLGESEKLSLKALKMAQEMNIPQYIRLSCQNLNDIYLKRGDYNNGYKYTVLYYRAKETIYAQKVLVQVQEFNNTMAVEKQQSENQKLLYEQKIATGRLHYFIALGILLMILLLVSVGFWIYQGRQQTKIIRIAGQLEQSNKFLRRFISILGHDLRSPFNGILGFTEILKNEPDLNDEDRQLFTGKLYDVSRSTFKLLESILEWSQIQSGSIKPAIRPCNLSELIQETIQLLEPGALFKRIEIRYTDPGAVMIDADPDMIMTILRNIISNAIKFTFPDGYVQIKLGISKSMAIVEISDNGMGIAREDLANLLQHNEPAKSKGTNGEPGSGLGLILCREYIGMHKGTLSVTSEQDKGSTFTIDLPVKSK